MKRKIIFIVITVLSVFSVSLFCAYRSLLSGDAADIQSITVVLQGNETIVLTDGAEFDSIIGKFRHLHGRLMLRKDDMFEHDAAFSIVLQYKDGHEDAVFPTENRKYVCRYVEGHSNGYYILAKMPSDLYKCEI